MSEQRISGMIPALVIAILTIIYMVTGYRTLDEESRFVPVMTAWITLFVLGLDLVAGWRSKCAPESVKAQKGVTVADEARALLSLLALVIAIYFLGFYAGGVLYLLVSLRWIGKQGLRFSIITTITAFVCIYLLFEQGLSFQLFRGVLFSEY